MTLEIARHGTGTVEPSAEDFPLTVRDEADHAVSTYGQNTVYPAILTPTAIHQPHHRHPHDAFTPHQLAHLMGTPTTPLPIPLQRLTGAFGHASNSHLLPAAGVLTMAGVSIWAHTQPHHVPIGGGIITVGAYLVRAGIKAHQHHGSDADVAFTKGIAGAGGALTLIGVGACVGLSPWMAVAVALGLGVAYIGWHQWAHHKLERTREFAVAFAAAGNTGPAPTAPLPWSASPGVLPVSDEEARIHAAFAKLKASPVSVSPVRRDGDVWSAYVDLRDTTKTPDEVGRAADKLITWMGARNIEVLPGATRSQVKLIVHDGEDPLEDTIHWDGRTATSVLDPIPLGVFEDGTEVALSLAWKHTLVCGTTDMGKSGVLNLILCSTLAAQDTVRILTDCKAGAPEFRAYRDVSFLVATTPEEGMRVLAGLEGIYRHRGELLVEKDVPPEIDEDGETVQKWRAEFGPYIIASIDELAELTGRVKGAAERIQSLRAVMRFVGMFALDATQTPAKDVFGGTTTARLNYLNRIALATAEQGATRMIFGEGMHGRGWRPDLLDLPGLMYVYSPAHKRPRKARAYRVDPQAVAQCVAAARGNVPDLDEGSAAAFWDAYHAEQAADADGGGDGPRGGRPVDSVDVAQAYHRGERTLYALPTYPDGMKAQHRALWDLLGKQDGPTTAFDLAAAAAAAGHEFSSESWVRGALRTWSRSEWVQSESKSGTQWFWRDDEPVDQRKDA